MTARATSRAAYEELETSGKLSRYQRQIMLFFHSRPMGTAITRRAIADYTGIPVNAVPRAVGVLIERKYLEELPEPVTDPVTKFKAMRVRIKPYQPELQLEAA